MASAGVRTQPHTHHPEAGSQAQTGVLEEGAAGGALFWARWGFLPGLTVASHLGLSSPGHVEQGHGVPEWGGHPRV